MNTFVMEKINLIRITSSDLMPEIKALSDVCVVQGWDGNTVFWRYVPTLNGSWDYKGCFKTEREAAIGRSN